MWVISIIPLDIFGELFNERTMLAGAMKTKSGGSENSTSRLGNQYTLAL